MSAVSNLLRANKKDSTAKAGAATDASSLHDAVHDAYMAYKDAEAAFRAVEAELLEKTDALYESNARNGRFSKSCNLPGIKSAGVQVTYQDKFASIPVESEEALREVLGSQYPLFFDEKRELQLANADDATIELLTEKLGQDTFLRLFNIKVSLSPKKDLDRRQFELPSEARAYLKQYKASVKLAK